MILNLNGRNVLYPVSLKILESNPTELLNEILNSGNLTNGEKVLQANDLLNKYNVPFKSFFFNVEWTATS